MSSLGELRAIAARLLERETAEAAKALHAARAEAREAKRRQRLGLIDPGPRKPARPVAWPIGILGLMLD